MDVLYPQASELGKSIAAILYPESHKLRHSKLADELVELAHAMDHYQHAEQGTTDQAHAVVEVKDEMADVIFLINDIAHRHGTTIGELLAHANAKVVGRLANPQYMRKEVSDGHQS